MNIAQKTVFKILLGMVLICTSCATEIEPRASISLAGEWHFALDPERQGVDQRWAEQHLSDVVTLPGTTDTNQRGEQSSFHGETRFLTRRYEYEGQAWYQREVTIPRSMEGKSIELYIERTKPTTLWVDGKLVGSQNSVTTPHRYDLTDIVEPNGATHTLTVMVDNSAESLPAGIFNSHNCSEHTQTNWNGMVGELSIRSRPKGGIKAVDIRPNVASNEVRVDITLNDSDHSDSEYTLRLSATSEDDIVESSTYELDHSGHTHCLSYSMGQNPLLWSEFAPNLYTLRVELIRGNEVIDCVEHSFGMRNFTARNNLLYNNGKRVFLRGKHDAAVFPITGYAPMDHASWERYFKICQDYGVNHVRFHSWTPPLAAVEAADKLGIYLQLELPLWGTVKSDDHQLIEYLKCESHLIMEEFANHPSVVIVALGNELKGDTNKLAEIVDVIKSIRPEILAATGANNNLGRDGAHSHDDVFVTCRIKGDPNDTNCKTHVRASFSFTGAPEGGYINLCYPNSKQTFESAFVDVTTPIIGHETGQFQATPNFHEIEKYTGVLRPCNLEVFQQRLDEAGMLWQSEEFFRASTKWQAKLYRADIEMNFRTDQMSGFQLLDLQDYPGQGSAFVGILDSFMDSKGGITPQDWRRFCSDKVALLIMDKYVWQGGDKFTAKAKLSNYSNECLKGLYSWQLIDSKAQIVASGEFPLKAKHGKLTTVGEISLSLPKVKRAEKMTLTASFGDEIRSNSYDIWVYPAKEKRAKATNFRVLQRVNDELFVALARGERVLFMPKEGELRDQSLKGLFQTDYWNYRMFHQISMMKGMEPSPGTMGMLIKDKHPALSSFPTEFCTDWQWFSIVKKSTPLIMDNLPTFEQPIVQVIDNFERNHKLSMIFECRVGKGKLLVCMSDLLELGEYPEAISLYNSLANYISSSTFEPTSNYTIQEIKTLLTTPVAEIELQDLKNVSYDYKKRK